MHINASNAEKTKSFLNASNDYHVLASIFKRYYKHMHTQITFEICTHVAQIKLDMRLAFELRV